MPRTSRAGAPAVAAPQERVDIIATRRWDESPERWTVAVTIDGHTTDLGPFPSIGRALFSGVQVYYASTVPPHLRKKPQTVLD